MKIDYIIHLAAQAGVRNSIKFPNQYFTSNIQGFHNILEISKFKKLITYYLPQLVQFMETNKFPLKENYNTDSQIILCCFKKSNEITAYHIQEFIKYQRLD